MRKIYTIGFSKKFLREFVKLLKNSQIEKLIDIRLNNTSQLSGYAKKDDLAYIMELINIEYVHDISLAPDNKLLSDYKKNLVDWGDYKTRYLNILEERNIKDSINELTNNKTVCLLCSEHKPNKCHRSLLASFIKNNLNEDLDIIHLI